MKNKVRDKEIEVGGQTRCEDYLELMEADVIFGRGYSWSVFFFFFVVLTLDINRVARVSLTQHLDRTSNFGYASIFQRLSRHFSSGLEPGRFSSTEMDHGIETKGLLT